jgi:uncharacterized protein (TIGR00725 family)
MKRTITVFGSSQPVEADEQYKFAYELGSLLAKNRFDVCTGGFFGIMEAVSKGAVENGAEAIGIIVDHWGGNANKFVTREIKCSTLFERINKLIETGDGYVILQGGTGTLLVLNKQMKLEGRDDDMVKSFNTVGEIVSYLVTNTQ